jgi:hypothetical protein
MPFDRSAYRAQVARIAAHHAGDEVLLRFLGKGEAFAAGIQADKLAQVRALEGTRGRTPCLVTLAREVRGSETAALVFGGEQRLPRVGDHFTDPAGKLLTITEDRSVPHAAVLVYACETSGA